MEPTLAFLHEFGTSGKRKLTTSSTAGFLWRYATGSAQLTANIGRAKAAGYEGNLKGEGLVHGGLFVVGTNGDVLYKFKEKEIGDHAPVEDVLAVCRDVAQRATQTC